MAELPVLPGHMYVRTEDHQLLMIVLFFPMISCGVRRLHDAGYSGMYYLFILIPFVGVAVLLVFLAQKSVPDNQWGLAAR